VLDVAVCGGCRAIDGEGGFLTDLVMGALAIEAGWKLKTPFASSTMRLLGLLPVLSLLSTDMGL